VTERRAQVMDRNQSDGWNCRSDG